MVICRLKIKKLTFSSSNCGHGRLYLPCELPKEASEGFGEIYRTRDSCFFVMGDKTGFCERAKMAEKEKLTPRFSYLQDYVDGK
jgi:hypothetical protein